MSESDTNLSTATLGVGVFSRSQSAFNTPTSGTPIPRAQLSDETISLLNEVSSKLKSDQGKPAPAKKDLKEDLQARKRKRQSGNTEGAKAEAMRLKYPDALKPLYLRTKTLYIKKLNLATSIHQIKETLKEGKFPPQTNFRSTPPTSDNEQFKTSWFTTVNGCKRTLTNQWVDELTRKYAVMKSQIQQSLAEMESILTKEQFTDIKKTLNEKYKTSAPGFVSKKARAGSPIKRPRAQVNRESSRQQKGRSNRQVQNLLRGLAKLLK